MKPVLFFLFMIIISCSVDYDFENLRLTEPECIIVNSILTPSEPLQVRLHKLEKVNNQYRYTALERTKITLKKGQEIIYDAVCEDSVFTMDHHPEVNATYTIEVSCDNLKTVKATTQIPQAIECRSYDFSIGEHYRDDEYIIILNSFEVPSTARISLWITAYRIYENGEEEQYNELYTNHALVDKTNSTVGMGIKNELVGSIYHNGFLRFKNKNLPFLEEVMFTPNFVHFLDFDYPDSPFS